ncbi:MAG: DUF4270 domain-containing protein [Lentimicrobium sp.]|nr:DUF4270 domain-containing protein [Lentimicrobium sp.]
MLKNRLLQITIIAIASIVITSCQKEPNLIGLDLLPTGEYLNLDYTDTSTLIAYTLREDSLRTDELSLNLLGSIADPVFGTTTASIYTQYKLVKNNLTFGENAVADSMVLTLVYKGIYGDSSAQKTIRVYEMADTINYDSAYYSTRTIATLPELIGEATFVPNLNEADSIDGVKMPPHMRVVLTQEFANKIINADTNDLANNENFNRVFKGLYITSEDATSPGTGSILYLDLLDAVSRLKLYYHNSEDTTSITFSIGSGSARFNHYDHFGYNGADPILIQQFNGDTTSGQQKLFVQAMGGAKIKLRIPYLKAIAENKKIAVNEALLIIKSDDTSGVYKMPPVLAMRKLNESGEYSTLPDEIEGSSFIGGTASGNKEYRFRITQYVQNRLLNPDEPDYGLMIIGAGSSISGNRAVLKGPGNETGAMKLVIYYTLVD